MHNKRTLGIKRANMGEYGELMMNMKAKMQLRTLDEFNCKIYLFTYVSAIIMNYDHLAYDHFHLR